MFKKTVVSALLVLVAFIGFWPSIVQAQTPSPLPVVIQQGVPPQGAWIIDPEVTTIGKNASRSGMLLDWTLRDYKWSSDASYTSNPLVPFWQIIQRIVYALFLFVILVAAFILIVTRGKSLSARKFLPRFLLVALLVTFSFSLVQFLYQIIDIFQGFFLRNPAGNIISSRDLLYIGFDYRTFQGLRLFGENYNESAFISLLFVKLTSFTYYVMAILLIFRKIILWFLIIISPVFPILLLFYPLRNTAKIWIGEFFRWLLYAPLFAIFLSGLVRLWSSSQGLPLVFSSNGVGEAANAVYPTAVNILLGGPGGLGKSIGINNSLNLPDTFALYLVALLMLWAVIILPFILLQIFLDYMMSLNYKESPWVKQAMSVLNNRPSSPLVPPIPPAPTGAGIARNLPFAKRFEMPKTTGLAREIPTSAAQTVTRPTLIQRNNQTEITRLTNLSIPTLRDIARFDTTKLSHDSRTEREIEKLRQNLITIANPAVVSSSTERERSQLIRDRLVTEIRKGNQVASTIFNAATTYNSYTSQTASSTISQATKNLVQQLAQPASILSKRDQQKIVEIKQELAKAAQSGNQFATTILNSVNNYSTNQVQNLAQVLNQLSQPEKVSDSQQKEIFTTLREKIISASKSGNPLATLLSQSLGKTTSIEQVKKIHEELLSAQVQGNPLASEILKTVSSSDKTPEKDMEKLHEELQDASKSGNPLATLLLKTLSAQEKPVTAVVSANAKLRSGTFPQVNRIQQVSLDDYEAVKKMWTDNYKNLEVPNAHQTRKEWITQDLATIQETVSLLSSTNQLDVEKGMQQVSDILPFLLIGGFSQTEIIAYLKAKAEAGKNVVENVTSQQEEEDTLLSAEKAAKQATNHLSASVEIHEGENINTTSNAPVTYNKTVIATTSQATPKISSAPINTTLLQFTELPIVTMRDIARYETTNRMEKEKSVLHRVEATLQNIAQPDKLPTPDKDKFMKLREEVVKENQKGNPLAAMILSATNEVGSLPQTLSAKEIQILIQIIQAALDPQRMQDSSMLADWQKLNQQILSMRSKADSTTLTLLQVSDAVHTFELAKTKELLEKLSNPTQIALASDKLYYTKLVERIAQASEAGNPTANLILKMIKDTYSDKLGSDFYKSLSSASIKGDQLATDLLQTIYTYPQSITSATTNLYTQLLTGKASGNVLASSLLRMFSKELTPAKPISATALPKQNRIQQVTLEDYEAVKKMWQENYSAAELNTNQSRESWIQEEIASVQQVINLLSSSSEQDVKAGMDQVSEILPFLLLGGFSQPEIISYLKAKMEAGKNVLESLTQSSVEQDVIEKKERVSPHTLQAEVTLPSMSIPQGQTHIVSDNSYSSQGVISQLHLPLPTLRDIASVETKSEVKKVQDLKELFAKLVNPQTIRSESERKNAVSIIQTLQNQAQKGDDTATMIMNALGISQNSQAVNPQHDFLMVLKTILDPSLAPEDDQAAYRKVRDELVKSRQESDSLAIEIMKLVDTISHAETDSLIKLLQVIKNPSWAVNGKEQEKYTNLRQDLELQKTTSKVAQDMLLISQGEITSVSANKLRMELVENAARNDQLATRIMKEYVQLPTQVIQQVTNLSQIIQKPSSDNLSKLLIKFVNQPKKTQGRFTKLQRFPRQNRIQQVTLDDYEAVKKMLYEMYLHAPVPAGKDGKTQSREEWITSEREAVEEEINLISSDDPLNVQKGMERVGTILPFLLIGGFSQNEVLQYLKAKLEAATMALTVIRDGTEKVDISRKSSSTPQENVAHIDEKLDSK